MADPKITDAKTSGLDTIAGEAKRAGHKGPPPVHLWNPPFCGDLDMRIAADGTWFYLKTPIGRRALVKLFASILKREGDKYFLDTPVEKCGIGMLREVMQLPLDLARHPQIGGVEQHHEPALRHLHARGNRGL